MATERKKKQHRPPTFHFLPKSRAKQLKKSWVQDRKIHSKWRAQKRREGLTSPSAEHAPSHRQDGAIPDPMSDTNRPGNPPAPAPAPAPSHDSQSLRNLRRIAYSKPPSTQIADSSHRGGKATAGQPVMKLRMNVLLEKIKRDLS